MEENNETKDFFDEDFGSDTGNAAPEPEQGDVTPTDQSGSSQDANPQYGNPQYGSDPYGNSQSGSGQYGNPQYGSDPYGNSQSGGSQYGNPQYGNAQYGNSQYGNGQYGNGQYGNQQYGDGQYHDFAYGGTYNPYGNPYYDNNNIPEYGDNGGKGYSGGFGVASLVLGIVSILCFCSGINIITGILSIIFGIIHISKHSGENATAIIGFVTSGLSLLVLVLCLAFIIFGSWDADTDHKTYEYNKEYDYDGGIDDGFYYDDGFDIDLEDVFVPGGNADIEADRL